MSGSIRIVRVIRILLGYTYTFGLYGYVQAILICSGYRDISIRIFLYGYFYIDILGYTDIIGLWARNHTDIYIRIFRRLYICSGPRLYEYVRLWGYFGPRLYEHFWLYRHFGHAPGLRARNLARTYPEGSYTDISGQGYTDISTCADIFEHASKLFTINPALPYQMGAIIRICLATAMQIFRVINI